MCIINGIVAFGRKKTIKIREEILKIVRRNNHEKNVPTQEKTEKQSTRIQRKNVYERRKKCFEEKKKQGKKAAFQVIFA